MRLRVLFVVSILAAPPARAGTIEVAAAATSPTQATVSWTWTEDPNQLTARPDWYGYDVLRRSSTLCSEFERINPTVILRAVATSHAREYVDTPPLPNQTWEYRVIFVDVNRTPLTLSTPDCYSPCQPPAWATVPALSAPVTSGLLQDLGWTLYLEACSQSCWPSLLVSGPIVQELIDQGLVGTHVALYGTAGCCTVEGPAMNATAYLPTGSCTPVPVRSRSWGQIKTIYR